DRLRTSLREVAGEGLEMRSKPVSSGAAIVLSVPTSMAGSIETAFTRAGVQEVPVPPSYGGKSVAEAVPKLLARLQAIPAEIEELDATLDLLRREEIPEVLGALAAFHDRLARLETKTRARRTAHAFVLGGWVPEAERLALETELHERFEGKLAMERVGGAELAEGSVPVALENPKLFRPFEALVKFLPLPHYGTIDPTPFVAVFFPMFFGLILGDVGYGALLAILAWILHRRSEPESLLSSLAKIGGACAAFSVLFGLLYGELFGDLGHELLGMPSLWFRREEALLPFLGLALALGFVHILLGLVLGVLGALRRGRREALGRGVAAVMIVMILIAILAAAEILPPAFFTPSIVALLVAFPLLVVAEGLLAPIELLASLSNIFSYARIMAIGTASVMMAVVANRMVGAVGSVVVGVLFALLFHLVNFVLGVFSPTIHALRLHYVEFFGKFYRPGGPDYDPLRHWATDRRERK
ncbi:MAG TPA: V-type ATPase 116kDa subunit family protein, partial [Vicinamibacteria bacterium]|nr:V-type ATPase 116kDa subunit family protein [Vicinamibacteria bacterium]